MLKISQPAVSKIEKQTDMYLSTLHSYVEAVGGEMDIVIRLPNRGPVKVKLASLSHVRLAVFNLLGQRVAMLVDDEQVAGSYRAQWDGTDATGRAVAAGVYVYRLTVGGAYPAWFKTCLASWLPTEDTCPKSWGPN